LDEGSRLSVGSILDDRYRIERVIGRGGMGAVYEAVRLDLGRRVAIKVLAAPADTLEATEREARAAAQLAHPHIVQVFDVSRGEAGGPPYFVMELLAGEPLAERIARDGYLEPGTAALVLVQVLSALGAAHGSGILHRDVKPANVFLTSTAAGFDFVKLLDFGVACIGPQSSSAARRYVEPVGTPAYMAPEQIRGAAVDERTDVWAAGVCLYEMLTGTAPFEAENVASLLVKICEGPPVPIETRMPEIDPGLAAIVRRALSHDPAARFRSAAEMRSALARYATASAVPSRESPFAVRAEAVGTEVTVDRSPPTMAAATRTPPPSARTLASTSSTSPRSRSWALAAALLLTTAVGWRAAHRTEAAVPSAEGCAMHAPLEPWLHGASDVRISAGRQGAALSAVTLDGRIHMANAETRGVLDWAETVFSEGHPGDRFFPCATVSEGEPMGGGVRVRPMPRTLFMQHGRPIGEAKFVGGFHMWAEGVAAEDAACASSGTETVLATYSDDRGTGLLSLVLFEGGATRRRTMNIPGSDGLLADVHDVTVSIVLHQNHRLTTLLFDRQSMMSNMNVVEADVERGNAAVAVSHDVTDVLWKADHSNRVEWKRIGRTGMAVRETTLASGDVFAPRIARTPDGVVVAWGERRGDRTYVHLGAGKGPEEAARRARAREIAPDARGLALAGGPQPWLAWIAGEGTAASVRTAPATCK
jgi:serine/threonine protein kinase